MTHDALRIGRVSLPKQIYHLTTVIAGRRPLLADFWLARAVIGEMRRLDADRLVESMAWVVMPDHVHWLAQLTGDAELADVMRVFKGRTARRINGLCGAQGSVWQKAFHDRAVRREDDLPALARYIVANPIRSGLVTRIGDYPHWDAVWL